MRVLIAIGKEDDWAGLPHELDVRLCAPPVESIDAAIDPETEILVTELLPNVSENCAGLKWVQFVASGVDYVAGHPLLRQEMTITSAAGICSVQIAEQIVARILYHQKEFRAFQELQREHVWPNRVAMARPCLRGKTALIIGYGGVGRETARLLSAFGMRIVAVEKTAERTSYPGYYPYAGIGDPDALLPERIVSSASLADVLPEADFILVAASLGTSTRRLIDAEVLGRAKPSAVLVNTSRAAITDTAALIGALDAGALAHAYLDVFDTEPLPADSPLWDHPRVSITPHMAGVMADVIAKIRGLFLENLELYKQGQTMINELDRRALLAGG